MRHIMPNRYAKQIRQTDMPNRYAKQICQNVRRYAIKNSRRIARKDMPNRIRTSEEMPDEDMWSLDFIRVVGSSPCQSEKYATYARKNVRTMAELWQYVTEGIARSKHIHDFFGGNICSK